MPNVKDTKSWKNKANGLWGDRFDYDLSKYISSTEPITIKCNLCETVFEETANLHISKRKRDGCPTCNPRIGVRTSKLLSPDVWERKASEKHNNNFQYLSRYNGARNSVTIKCITCGTVSEQNAFVHMQCVGCSTCGKVKTKKPIDYWLPKIKGYEVLHYSTIGMTNVVNTKKPLTLRCIECDYECELSIPYCLNHGCGKCSKRVRGVEGRLFRFATLKADAVDLHGSKYTYHEDTFINQRVKMLIHCNTCSNDFKQNMHTHLKGKGCPHCRSSKGETQIKAWLESKNIAFTPQKTFSGCRYKHLLRFDIYVDGVGCIEFNGGQHYRPVGLFGGWETFKLQLQRDSIKRAYCCSRGIPLHIIRYDENINERMVEILGLTTNVKVSNT